MKLEVWLKCAPTVNNNKRPLTPKSMPPTGDEHVQLTVYHTNVENWLFARSLDTREPAGEPVINLVINLYSGWY